MNKFICLFCTVCILSSCQLYKDEEIRIGVLAPMTGPMSTVNPYAMKAIEMANEKINEEGGLNGKSLKFIYEDINICSPKLSVDAVKKFIDVDRVPIVLSVICGGNQVVATAEITEENEIVQLSSSAVIGKISDMGEMIFRNLASDIQEMDALAEFTVNKLGKKMFIIHNNAEWGQSYRDAMKKSFEKYGAEVVGSEMTDVVENDYRTYITKAKNSDADVVFANVFDGNPLGVFLQQAKELDLDKNIVTSYKSITDNTLEIAKNAADYVFYPYPILSNSSEANEIREEYKERYGIEMDIHGIYTYDMVMMMAESLRECGEDTSCVSNYFYEMEEYDGLGGKTSFDEKGDIQDREFIMKVIIDGERHDVEFVMSEGE